MRRNFDPEQFWSWTWIEMMEPFFYKTFCSLIFSYLFPWFPLISLAISVTRCEPSGLVTTPRCSRFSCLCSNASVTLRRNCRSCCRCALQSWQWLSPTCSIQFFFFALKFHLIYLNIFDIFDIFDFIVSEWLESFGLGSLLNSGGATSHLRGDGKNGTNMTEQNTQIIQSQNGVQIRWDKQKTWGDGNGRRLISLMVGLCQLNALKTLKQQF